MLECFIVLLAPRWSGLSAHLDQPRGNTVNCVEQEIHAVLFNLNRCVGDPCGSHVRLEAGYVDLEACESVTRANYVVLLSGYRYRDGRVLSFLDARSVLGTVCVERQRRESLVGSGCFRRDLGSVDRDARRHDVDGTVAGDRHGSHGLSTHR